MGTSLEALDRAVKAGKVRSLMMLGPSYKGDRRGVSVHLRVRNGAYRVGYGKTFDAALDAALAKTGAAPVRRVVEDWESLV